MATSELRIVIEKLKQASVKFNNMEQEADIALNSRRDVKEYRSKLIERGQLLVALENDIAVPLSTLKGTEKELAFEIKGRVAAFAWSAKEGIKKNNMFWLGVLLKHKGHTKGNKDALEKLIEHLELKQ